MAKSPFKLTVKSATKAMSRDLTKVQRKIVPKITSQALNFTAKKVKTQTVRRVSAATGVKQKIVRGRLRFQKLSKPQTLKAIISAWFMPVPAIKLGKAKGLKSGPPTFSKKFIATMKSGHEGIFSRKSPKRLPIKETMVNLNPVAEDIIVKLMGRFVIVTYMKEWQRLLSVRLRRKG